MRVGSTKGVSGYQWNTGTILFTILSGVYSREREGCGAEGRTVPCCPWNTLWPLLGGEREQKEVSERKTEKGGRGGGGVYQAYNRGSPLKNYLFLAGWTVAPPRRSPRLDWFLHARTGDEPKLRIPPRSTPTKQRESNELVPPPPDDRFMVLDGTREFVFPGDFDPSGWPELEGTRREGQGEEWKREREWVCLLKVCWTDWLWDHIFKRFWVEWRKRGILTYSRFDFFWNSNNNIFSQNNFYTEIILIDIETNTNPSISNLLLIQHV